MSEAFQHPELQEGEVFLGNFREGGFSGIAWRTKRMGLLVYGEDGKSLGYVGQRAQLRPVFVQKLELDEATTRSS